MIENGQMFKLFYGMKKSLVITDSTGLIIQANRDAQKLLGMSEDELRKRHIHALITPRQKEILIREISRSEGKGPIMWLLESRKNHDDNEELNGSSTFLAAMTHEIRTPMNGIIGMTDLAMEESMSPELEEYLNVIRLSADSLMRVINDILDYTKIESGKLGLEEISIKTDDFLDNIAKLFRSQAEAVGLSFRYNKSSDLPEAFIGDPVRIRQIIQNLLNNALKFTPEGSIELTACTDNASPPREIHFYVTDTGIGIPAEKQHLLFRSFTQVDSSTTRKYGGTGLGLAICAYLTALMDGRIDVKSKKDKGSTFRFFLPIRHAENAEEEKRPSAADVSPEEEGAPENSPLILLLEDNRVNQMLAVKTMTKAGYRVVTAENGLEGIDRYKEHNPDLILMDIQMPEMDGYETSRQIRNLEAGKEEKQTPIVALTALALHEDRQKILDAGMNDFLGKPVSPLDLKEMLLKYCKQ